jgi:Holliday junction resolvase
MGTAAENELKDILEAMGYWAIRAAGSHGEFDVVAICAAGHSHPEMPVWWVGWRALLFDVKYNTARTTKAERAASREIAARAHALAVFAHRHKGGGWEFEP